MKPVISLIALTLLVVAACSESGLPTETRLFGQPRLEISVIQGGCPSPFMLAYAYTGDGAAADRNGDSLACYLTHSRTDGEFEIVFGVTWTDNNVPLNQIGGCPNSFELTISKGGGGERDTNGDGLTCIRVNGNGSTIEIDNNHRT